ncbi:MAG: sulfide/dihydroorotate dehydrogenase-like FAD/NAD-binding protein, partial [Vicinamibacterales bacterium]|nr:sulfide/dihydroorotate dehydrogenase-like FAD/NAD-binding protein [Vicinamibacterales bacterium]
MNEIRLVIDGQDVKVDEGRTVLQAARSAGIVIPTVCDHKDLSSFGACRMCVVEIDGVRGFPTSCTTPATQGLVVRTKTPEVLTLRNRVLEMLLSAHPDSCLVCNHREECEKFRPREIKAGKTTRCSSCANRPSCGIRELSLSGPARELNLSTIYLEENLERDDPFMDRDHNLCILCGLCWRICEKLHDEPPISSINRGAKARVGTPFNASYADAGCTFCGACIDICPTGTFSDRYAKWQGNPVHEVQSTCALCPEACAMTVSSNGRRLVATAMQSFDREALLCALGRFAYPQVMSAHDRLQRPMVREGDGLVAVGYEAAIATAAAALQPYVGDGFVALVSESDGREARRAWEVLARDVMKGRVGYVPSGGGFEELFPPDVKQDLLAGKVSAAVVAGDFLDKETAARIPHLVAVDFRASAATAAAEVALPAAVLGEVEATLRSHRGELRRQARVVAPPGAARADWEIARDLAKALGADGRIATRLEELTASIVDDAAPAPPVGSPRDDLKALPTRFRGHLLADMVVALDALGLPSSPKPQPVASTEGFLVVAKREIVPNFHLLELEVPQVARFAKAGQFVIVMPKATSERTPYTLGDWNAEKGTITIVVEEVGRSSRELALLRAGDRVAHVTGPLGAAYPIPTGTTVALGGGCYGVAAIHPIARALKQAGNRVIGVIEGCSDFSIYFEKELEAVCDEVRYVTKDGSRGMKGGVGEVFVDLVSSGVKVDRFVAIGCTFMMMLTSEATRALNIRTDVALNPIMVDGTGMCGACRLSIDGETKFACVDGPIFDGHKVDWQELS